MTKLSIARIFEVSQVAASKAYGELQPFIDYVNSFTDNVIRVLQNGVGIRDNLDAEIKVVTLTHGSPTGVSFRKRPIAVLLCGESGTATNPATSLHASPGDGSQANLTIRFQTAATAQVTVVAFFS